MKKATVVILLVIALLIAAFFLIKRKKNWLGGGSDRVTIEPPPANATQLTYLSGEGKRLFDLYRAKFSTNAANTSEALAGLDVSSIFDGVTKMDVWATPVLSSQNIPLILTLQAKAVLKNALKLAPTTNLWTNVESVRGSVYQVRDTSGVNLLPNRLDDANAYIQQVLCPYSPKCSGNDKDRNKEVRISNADVKALADFQKIAENWLLISEAADLRLDSYTIEQLNAGGFKIS